MKTTETFQAVLPAPPTANNLFPTGKSGRRFISPEYKAWIAEAEKGFKAPAEPLKGRYRAFYEFQFRDNRRRDIANFEKATTDFLVKQGVIQDDCQIDSIIIKRGKNDARHIVNVFVEAFE